MKSLKKIILSMSVLMASAASSAAQDALEPIVTPYVDSVQINFIVSKWDLVPELGDNAEQLDRIDHRLTNVFGDSIFTLRHVSIFGGASPEGSVKFNEFLSEHRAATLFDYLSKYRELTDADKDYTFYGRDWDGVLSLARLDPDVPYRDETIALLETIANEKRLTGHEPARSLERMKALRGGAPYRYLLKNIFPQVRASKVVVYYDKVLRPDLPPKPIIDTVYVDRPVTVYDTIYIEYCPPCKPFYMDIRTNMLYDALALPNIGVDFYLGKNFSIGANWMYAWWKTDKRHRYWRAYGGEINGRWWFGSAAQRKPLTGHHLGVYGQFYTYDFEWGGDGEMGGKPGGTLWDKGLWAAGLEYGYTLPISRRINFDFSLGLGYSQGHYHKYTPADNCYVWKSTHSRHYFGPTKVEVALVWLIGCDNFNKPKRPQE